jgi:DNA-binding transcriptional LysR family regulator
VSLADLAGQDLLLPARGTAFRDVLDSAAAQQDVELRPKAEFDGMRLLTSLAFAGFGAGIVPASAIPANYDGSWRWIPIEGVPGRSVGLARRRRGLLTAAQRVVAERIRTATQEGAVDVPGVYPAANRPAR